jgi:hypothetical protein
MTPDFDPYQDYRNALANHEPSDKETPPKTRKRNTREQREALKKYNFALAQEDRYLGSVFVTADGQRKVEAKTKAAYAKCKALGMTHENGL